MLHGINVGPERDTTGRDGFPSHLPGTLAMHCQADVEDEGEDDL